MCEINTAFQISDRCLLQDVDQVLLNFSLFIQVYKIDPQKSLYYLLMICQYVWAVRIENLYDQMSVTLTVSVAVFAYSQEVCLLELCLEILKNMKISLSSGPAWGCATTGKDNLWNQGKSMTAT